MAGSGSSLPSGPVTVGAMTGGVTSAITKVVVVWSKWPSSLSLSMIRPVIVTGPGSDPDAPPTLVAWPASKLPLVAKPVMIAVVLARPKSLFAR
mgnify:CR=1 FL=1